MTHPAAGEAVDTTQPATHTHTESDSPEVSPQGFTLFAVLRKDPGNPDDLDGHDVPRVVNELDDVIALVEAEGVTVRGFYDVSGLRADADVMIWTHAPEAETLQWHTGNSAARACSRACSPLGTPWACTATPNSTRATCPDSCAASRCTPMAFQVGSRLLSRRVRRSSR